MMYVALALLLSRIVKNQFISTLLFRPQSLNKIIHSNVHMISWIALYSYLTPFSKTETCMNYGLAYIKNEMLYLRGKHVKDLQLFLRSSLQRQLFFGQYVYFML